MAGEVRIGTNCDRGSTGTKHRSQVLYLPDPGRAAFSNPRSQLFTISRTKTFLAFSSCRKLAHKWVCLRNFAIEFAYAPST